MGGFTLFLIVFAVMALVVLGMSAGVLAGRAPIAGSCGGIANLGIEKQCSICGGVREKCDEVNAGQNAIADNAVQAYDATKR
ncbi:MAG: (Na+)-NQR maturation NqrM [Gammaproteobacteria bacterium]|nr:(Na+)-NQR maturation NqrM [Gammaproteobacteria bacterium]HKM25971.1 (Na+)-NQR maturation NqrM [Thiopseudomonas sp.]